MNHNHNMGNMQMPEDSPPFCHLPATNMLTGLMTVMQATKAYPNAGGTHGGGTCLVFLFHGVVMDSPVKYAFGIVGAFLMAFTLEWLRCLQRKSLLSYLVMLLAMTFEAIFLLAVILGLGAGHVSFHVIPSLKSPTNNQAVTNHCAPPSSTNRYFTKSEDNSSITIMAERPSAPS